MNKTYFTNKYLKDKLGVDIGQKDSPKDFSWSMIKSFSTEGVELLDNIYVKAECTGGMMEFTVAGLPKKKEQLISEFWQKYDRRPEAPMKFSFYKTASMAISKEAPVSAIIRTCLVDWGDASQHLNGDKSLIDFISERALAFARIVKNELEQQETALERKVMNPAEYRLKEFDNLARAAVMETFPAAEVIDGVSWLEPVYSLNLGSGGTGSGFWNEVLGTGAFLRINKYVSEKLRTKHPEGNIDYEYLKDAEAVLRQDAPFTAEQVREYLEQAAEFFQIKNRLLEKIQNKCPGAAITSDYLGDLEKVLRFGPNPARVSQKNCQMNLVLDARTGIIRLMAQHGYTMAETVNALSRSDEELDANGEALPLSIRREYGCHGLADIPENADLVFLFRMRIPDICMIKEMYDERMGSITIPKDTVCGYVNKELGCGGPMRIRLEKDIILSMKDVRRFEPDRSNTGYCSVRKICGLSDEAWKAV